MLLLLICHLFPKELQKHQSLWAKLGLQLLEVWHHNLLCIHFVETLYAVHIISFVRINNYIDSWLQ